MAAFGFCLHSVCDARSVCPHSGEPGEWGSCLWKDVREFVLLETRTWVIPSMTGSGAAIDSSDDCRSPSSVAWLGFILFLLLKSLFNGLNDVFRSGIAVLEVGVQILLDIVGHVDTDDGHVCILQVCNSIILIVRPRDELITNPPDCLLVCSRPLKPIDRPTAISLLSEYGSDMVKKEIGIAIEEETVDEIDSHLEYGDSRSAWIRDAIRMKLEKIEQEEEAGNGKPATA